MRLASRGGGARASAGLSASCDGAQQVSTTVTLWRVRMRATRKAEQ
ncbi:hypothetical protein [Asaia krungthepensis]|nr:hypothetical protein [Asaia krungthepensis]